MSRIEPSGQGPEGREDELGRGRHEAAPRDKAADPDVSLSWFDAAVLTERARQQVARAEQDHTSRMG